MTALVGRLDVQEEEVVIVERAEPVLGLAAEVRVEVAGRARHADATKAGKDTEPVHEIHGGDDRAVEAVALAQRRHLRALALPPEPDRRRHALATLPLRAT